MKIAALSTVLCAGRSKNSKNTPSLRRTLSPFLTLCYGLGTILGAGVYVLVGKVAGYAGLYAPLSFLLASIVATFTALSYAELSSRLPKAAGEATYVDTAFGRRWLTALTGWLVVATGVISAAALTRGLVGYVQVFFPLSGNLIVILSLAILTLLACWGVGQSVFIAAVITLIEVGGLLLVIAFSLGATPSFTHTPQFEGSGVALGAFLAFYAFIGFEDMVNLAEEVRQPRKTLPIALLSALGIATLLYVLTACAAVWVLPLELLAGSDAPFAVLFEALGHNPIWISAISLVAILNGVLVQIIMAARVMYGMGGVRAAPTLLSRVSHFTQTPIVATSFGAALVLLLALFFPVEVLAQVTSFVILIVFALVNLSLVVMERGRLPKTFPVIGCVLCLLLIIMRLSVGE